MCVLILIFAYILISYVGMPRRIAKHDCLRCVCCDCSFKVSVEVSACMHLHFAPLLTFYILLQLNLLSLMCMYGCYIWVFLGFSAGCGGGWSGPCLPNTCRKVNNYVCNKSRLERVSKSLMLLRYVGFDFDFCLCTDFLCRYAWKDSQTRLCVKLLL